MKHNDSGIGPTGQETRTLAPRPHPSSLGPHPFQVAIDGPAGAGKSTVARGVARALGFVYVDTGAMYRAIALKVRRMTGPDADPDWGAVAAETDLRFETGPNGQRIHMDGEDVEDAIRVPEISDWSSRVSADPRVRAALTRQMRDMGHRQNVVMEGRDIGTVVLPDARLKIFLTAPDEERARRRADELKARGKDVRFEDVLADLRARDARDTEREAAPLIQAPDALVVDTAGMSPDEVIAAIVRLACDRQTGSSA